MKVKNNGRMKNICPFKHLNPGRKVKNSRRMKRFGPFGNTPIPVEK
jgi:hypothetical protein